MLVKGLSILFFHKTDLSFLLFSLSSLYLYSARILTFYFLLVTSGLACFSSPLSSKVTLFIWGLPFFPTVDIVSLFPISPFLPCPFGRLCFYFHLSHDIFNFCFKFLSWPITHSGPCCLISTYLWKSNFPPVIEF